MITKLFVLLYFPIELTFGSTLFVKLIISSTNLIFNSLKVDSDSFTVVQ